MTRWRRSRGLFGLDPQADVDHELRFHLEMRVRELIDRGEPPDRARELALLRFGDYETARGECEAIDTRRKRRMVRAEHLSEFRQDVHYALRMLRRAPGFTAVAVLTLALGVGANSAIFSVVYGVLLHSLPYRAAERLHVVQMLYPDGTAYSHLSPPDFMSVREGARVFEQVEAYRTDVLTLVDAGEPREIEGVSVSTGLFDLLGMRVSQGRAFARDEHQAGRGQVAVLDDGFWTREFGRDPNVLGKTVSVSGTRATIVGVLAPDARVPAEADLYLPLEYDQRFSASTAQGRRGESLNVVGRARPGTTAAEVDADVKRLGADLQRAFPETNEALTFAAQSLRESILGDVEMPLLVLLGAVGCVLLVACANIANLLLARGSARQGELAVRAALGAGRGRLLRQLLTEALVLALIGGALGLALAYAGAAAIVAAEPADIPRLDQVGVDSTVVVFTFITAIVTSLAFGVLPALQATATQLTPALAEQGRGGFTGGGGHRTRAALVVAEVALAVVLLVGAGLLVRSFVKLTGVESGFRAANAMAFRVRMLGDAYQERPQVLRRLVDIEARLKSLPGVTAAGATSLLPFSGRGALVGFSVEGAPPPPANVNQEIGIASVTPDYFRAIGTPLVRGRGFTDRDHGDAPRVTVFNEAAVRFWLPERDPLGARVNMNGTIYEVVGVVGDVLQGDPGQRPLPQMFVPYAQRVVRAPRVVVRTSGDAMAVAGAIRAEIHALDPKLPIADMIPLEQLATRAVARPRFYTTLLALFAGVALALAATGIFGVMSYAVAQRTREIGIRIALGANVADVLRMIVARAVALAAGGIVVGIAAAMALGRFLQSQLFGVALLDPVTMAGVVLVLLTSAGLASWLPAWRAATVDPVRTLRQG